MHGPTVELHDQRLTTVLERLQEKGLTLNPEKCEFRIPRITFMGHHVSEKGIGPTQAKVEAVLNAREPQSAAEVRSFLGLVNFCSRFIPNLRLLRSHYGNLLEQKQHLLFGVRSKRDLSKN